MNISGILLHNNIHAMAILELCSNMYTNWGFVFFFSEASKYLLDILAPVNEVQLEECLDRLLEAIQKQTCRYLNSGFPINIHCYVCGTQVSYTVNSLMFTMFTGINFCGFETKPCLRG